MNESSSQNNSKIDEILMSQRPGAREGSELISGRWDLIWKAPVANLRDATAVPIYFSRFPSLVAAVDNQAESTVGLSRTDETELVTPLPSRDNCRTGVVILLLPATEFIVVVEVPP
jgi:hypothetical protein